MAALGVRNLLSEFYKITIFKTNKNFAGNNLRKTLKSVKSKQFILSSVLLVNRVPALCNNINSSLSPPSSAFGHFLRPAFAGLLSCRGFSSDPGDSLGKFKKDNEDGDDDRKPLRLMDFNELIWPHPLKTLRNYFFSWLIRGYFDEQFSRETFLTGTEQAVSHVANLISQGNFEALDGLVAKEAIQEISRSYQSLSLKQRKFIAVNPKDLFFRFIYEIGLIFDDKSNRRFVEITTVLQGVHGLDEARQKNPESYAETISKAQDQVYVCNYRFIREYTKGITDDWTINKLNHFSPKEVVRDKGIFTR